MLFAVHELLTTYLPNQTYLPVSGILMMKSAAALCGVALMPAEAMGSIIPITEASHKCDPFWENLPIRTDNFFSNLLIKA